MNRHSLPDDVMFPPFEGFPKEGISFLKKLKRNNNRGWFAKHGEEYETLIKLPMYSLIASLQPRFDEFAGEFDLNPKRSVFRIYRDIRFSKDKTPYKTHIAAHIVLRGKPKGFEGSGYYLHIEPGEAFVGAGIYMPDSDQLKKIRSAISSRSAEFLAIINDKKFKKLFGTLSGNRLQRMPLPFKPEHPMADWLKLKQFFAGKSFNEKICTRSVFLELTASACETATPLVRFLNDALSK